MTDIILKKGLPPAFLWTGCLSAFLTVICIINSSPNWVLAIVVLCSVIFYGIYINFLTIDKNQNDADSIYYLGFGLTIIALAVSSYVHFGSAAKFDLENLKLVFSQFAIGLVATCIGLIGRLIVVAKLEDEVLSEDDEAQRRSELVRSLGDLRLEVVGFADQLKQLNAELRQQQMDLYADTMKNMQQLHQQVMQANASAIKLAHEEINQATQASIAQVVQMTETLAQQQVRLHTEAYAGLAELSQKTHEQIRSLDFVTVSKATNQAVQQLSDSCNNFATEAEELQQHLQLKGDRLEQHTTHVAHNLAQAAQQLGQFSQSVQQHDAQIQQFTQAVGQNTQQLLSAGRQSEQVLAAMNQQYEKYGQVNTQYLTSCAETIQKTTASAEAVTNALIKVTTDSVKIAQRFRDSANSTRRD